MKIAVIRQFQKKVAIIGVPNNIEIADAKCNEKARELVAEGKMEEGYYDVLIHKTRAEAESDPDSALDNFIGVI